MLLVTGGYEIVFRETWETFRSGEHFSCGYETKSKLHFNIFVISGWGGGGGGGGGGGWCNFLNVRSRGGRGVPNKDGGGVQILVIL